MTQNGASKRNIKKYARFLQGRNHQKYRASPLAHNCQQEPFYHISSAFSCCQNYKLGRWKIKSAIIKANQEGKSTVIVWQMYSKSLTGETNAALKFQADLKQQYPSIQGYVKFPATPIIKRTGERKYSPQKEF